MIACVDDYHNIHGTRIPSTNSTSQIAHMATILFNTAQTSPIPYYSNTNSPIHNCHGVDASLLKTICKEQFMITLANSYNSVKSAWGLTTDFIIALFKMVLPPCRSPDKKDYKIFPLKVKYSKTNGCYIAISRDFSMITKTFITLIYTKLKYSSIFLTGY